MPSLSIVRPEGYAGVMTAKAEGIGKTQGEGSPDRYVGGLVKVALGIRGVQVDGGRADAVTEGKERCNGLCCACCAEHMAGHGLGGGDVGLVCEVSESHLAGHCFRNVVEVGAGAVGVDVEVVLGRVEAGFLKGVADGTGLGAGVRAGSGGVVGVAGVAVPHNLAVDGGASVKGVVQGLQDKDGGAVSHHEALPVGVEGEG